MRNRNRLAAIVLGAAGVAALAAGCSSGSTPTPAANGQTGLAAYTACLARNGVTLPSAGVGRSPGAGRSGFPSTRPSTRPSGGGGFGGGAFSSQAPTGVDQATWAKAQAACASVRPTAGANNGGNNSAFAAYRNCLSDHGVTITAGPNAAALNTADPKVAAADAACAPLRPTGAPRPTPTPAG